MAGHGLGQEVGAGQVGGQHLGERLLGGLQQVGALPRRDAGVVHQHLHTAELLQGGGQQARAVGRHGDVRLHRMEALSIARNTLPAGRRRWPPPPPRRCGKPIATE